MNITKIMYGFSIGFKENIFILEVPYHIILLKYA